MPEIKYTVTVNTELGPAGARKTIAANLSKARAFSTVRVAYAKLPPKVPVKKKKSRTLMSAARRLK